MIATLWGNKRMGTSAIRKINGDVRPERITCGSYRSGS